MNDSSEQAVTLETLLTWSHHSTTNFVKEPQLTEARCAMRCVECNRRIVEALEWGRHRALRLTARYCSNACRQRAYRKRKAEG